MCFQAISEFLVGYCNCDVPLVFLGCGATGGGGPILFFFSQRFADSSLSVDHSHTHTNQTLVNENLNLSPKPNIRQMPRRGIQEITSGTKDVLYFGSSVLEVRLLRSSCLLTRLEKIVFLLEIISIESIIFMRNHGLSFPYKNP